MLLRVVGRVVQNYGSTIVVREASYVFGIYWFKNCLSSSQMQ